MQRNVFFCTFDNRLINDEACINYVQLTNILLFLQ